MKFKERKFIMSENKGKHMADGINYGVKHAIRLGDKEILLTENMDDPTRDYSRDIVEKKFIEPEEQKNEGSRCLFETDTCKDGEHFWRDTWIGCGIDEAVDIFIRYFDTQMRREQDEEEKKFCFDAFLAFYDDTAERLDPKKIVYPYSREKAFEREEESCYRISKNKNIECAVSINNAISASRYDRNCYNLRLAAMRVICEYGFERTAGVLANQINAHDYDARYSSANKTWTKNFDIPKEAFKYASLNAHPCLIDGFTKHVRELYGEFSALDHNIAQGNS
jgi:hypothetical protein